MKIVHSAVGCCPPPPVLRYAVSLERSQTNISNVKDAGCFKKQFRAIAAVGIFQIFKAILHTHTNTISKMTKTIYKSERKEKKNHILYSTTFYVCAV